MKVHDALAHAIRDVSPVVFGLLGDANLFIMDSFCKTGGQYVAFAHESGAVLAAVGYAQRTGGLGVATVTHGPAVSNTITGLFEAVKSHSPIVVVAGDTALADVENVQNIPQREVVQSSGAGFLEVTSRDTVYADMQRAVDMAILERRPVVLNVPTDLQWHEVDTHRQITIPAPATNNPGRSDVEEVTSVLLSARRPLILAGRGAALSDGGRDQLLALATHLGAPLATTVRAKDMFIDHPWSIGIFGSFANEEALDVINKADTVVAFGASLNKWTTAEGALLQGKRVVQVDIDRDALGRWSPVTVAIEGDIASTAKDILDLLVDVGEEPTGFAVASVQDTEAGHDVSLHDEEELDLSSAAQVIEDAFPRPRTVVFDVGRFWYPMMPRITVSEPLAHVHTVSSGSIGLSVPCAIGAAFARPDESVLVVVGDGGFMHGGLAELNTAVRYGLDITVIVMNDGAYGAEWVQLENRELDPSISTFDWPNFSTVAAALGADGVDVHTLTELRAALRARRSLGMPRVLNVHFKPAGVPMGAH